MKLNKAYFYYLINSKNISIKDFRTKIGMGMTTWYKRMNCADNFSLAEMCKIKEVLELTDKELLELFFNS